MATKTSRKSSLKKGGLFNWEQSYFGGIQRMVYDFPYISIPSNIEYGHKSVRWLNYFEGKCLKIFILKVQEHKLIDMFINRHSIVSEKDAFGNELSYMQINHHSIKECVDYIILHDADMSSLFEDEIVNSLLISECYMHILFPPEDDKKTSPPSPALMSANTIKKVKKGVTWNWSGGKGVSQGKLKENTVFKKVVSKGTCRYDTTQRKDAENLIRMLDVNYDKKHDKIDSLKCGKLSPQKIAEVPAGNMHIYHRVEEDQATKPFSVVILCDESGSMEGHGMNQQYSLVKTLYLAFSQIMPSENIFVFGHTGISTPDVYIYQDKFNPGFEDNISDQRERELGENYDGPVLESIYERVRKQAPNDNILMVVISDGSPSGHDYGGSFAVKELQRVVEKCKRDSFVIVGVGLGDYGGVKTLYKYNTIISHKGTDLVKNVSKVINVAVKTEFQ
jgi:hypothetical protein